MFRTARRLLLAACVLFAVGLLCGSSAEAQRRYQVRSGDTLISIAQRFGVGVRQLQRANRMRGDTIRPGDRLRIPGAGAAGRQNRGGNRWSGVYRVREGDSLNRIARRFRVSVRDLQRANRMRGTTIHPGDRLRIPGRGGGRQRPQGARPQELDDSQRQALARAEELGLGTSRVAHTLLTDPPEPAWIEAAGEDDGDGTLAAPVEDGVLLRGWGSGAGGYHLAIDVGAEPGTPIHAVERGIVAYVGRAVRGYGNVVIVVHPKGWVTWYAHNRQNRVVAGQRVERGEPIATVGATGYARGAHLHFMLVHQGEHCDALPLMRPGYDGRGGEALDVARARWTDEQPEAVRCVPKSERPHPRRRRRARR